MAHRHPYVDHELNEYFFQRRPGSNALDGRVARAQRLDGISCRLMTDGQVLAANDEEIGGHEGIHGVRVLQSLKIWDNLTPPRSRGLDEDIRHHQTPSTKCTISFARGPDQTK